MNNSNQEQINRIINNLTEKLNSPQKNQKPDEKQVDDLLKGLNETQINKIKSVLNDPKATEKILNSPQAQALIKKFGDKK